MFGLRKVFVGVGLAVFLAVASGPAAFAQDSDNSSSNEDGNSVAQSGVRNEGVANSDVTGGQRTAGNNINRASNVNQGSSSIAGGVTSNGAPVSSGAPLAATSSSAGAPASSKASASKTPAAAATGDLARTGSYTTQLALLGFGALLVGCLMVRYSWRPRMLVSASATHVREALSALADLHSRA